MRIAFVIPAYLPAYGYGGPVSAISSIAQALVQRGHEVTVLTSDLRTSAGERIDIRLETHEGVRIVRFPATMHYKWAAVSGPFIRQARQHLADLDVIHICAYRDGFGPVAASAAAARDIPYVWEPMGMLRPVGRSPIKKRLFDASIGHRQIASAAAVIATSTVERDECLAAGLDSARVVVRPNPVRTPAGTMGDTGAVRRSLGLTPEDFVVLYLGRIAQRKGLDLAAQAVASIGRSASARATRFVLVGPDENDGALDSVKAALSAQPESLIVAPAVFDDSKYAVLAAADAFVLPSPYGENYGISAAEAMAVGTPAIVSPACGVRDAITTESGRVIERTIPAWSQTLADIRDGHIRFDRSRVRMAVESLAPDAVALLQLSIYQTARALKAATA